MHAFISRDGINPNSFRAIAWRQLATYPNVRLHFAEAIKIRRLANGTFNVHFSRGAPHNCRKVLVATGVLDQLPQIANIEKYFGRSVHQCPYCDGWETRNQHIAIYGNGRKGFEMARAMTAWSSKLTLCTDGPARLSGKQREQLTASGIQVISTKIHSLIGKQGWLRAIRFIDNHQIACEALFFDTASASQSQLAQSLGCRMSSKGAIHCTGYEASSVPGVYAAGNIVRDVQLSIVAAAEGARAAFGINRALTREKFAQEQR
jgi:thioredoxin reductase